MFKKEDVFFVMQELFSFNGNLQFSITPIKIPVGAFREGSKHWRNFGAQRSLAGLEGLLALAELDVRRNELAAVQAFRRLALTDSTAPWPILNTQACDLCERLPTSIAEVSPGFAAQVPEARLEPQVVA